MILIVQIIGILGFFICLFFMYLTDIGIRGIRVYDPSFHFPDMKFRYDAELITQTFYRIGHEGMAFYRNYLILDYAFTICFLIVMLSVSNSLGMGSAMRGALMAICIVRAVCDVVENSLLLFLINRYPDINGTVVSISSCITSLKFIMLYLWLGIMIVQVFKAI